MHIYDLIKVLNKKSTVRDTRVMEVKKYILSLYRANMVYMYDKGYVSDPTVFNRKEVLGNVVDLGIRHLVGVGGKIDLSEDMVGYALARSKGNTEVCEFLELLLNVVTLKGLSDNLDKFYDTNGFFAEGRVKVSLKLTQSGSKVYSKMGCAIDDGVLLCLNKRGTRFRFVSLYDKIYERALRELGLDGIKSDSSLFVKGLSREEEARYGKLILNGLVNLDGEYADVLKEWLGKNKWSNNARFSSQTKGLFDWVVYVDSNNTLSDLSDLLTELISKDERIVSMSSYGFYIVDKDATEVDYPVGLFAVVSGDEDNFLPINNSLEWFTGEVYSIEYLMEHGLHYIGCPIELFIDKRNKGYFVDKEQTELKDSISWFAHNSMVITFDGSEYKEGKFIKGTFEDKLYRIVCEAEDGVLIGKVNAVDFRDKLDKSKKEVGNKL